MKQKTVETKRNRKLIYRIPRSQELLKSSYPDLFQGLDRFMQQYKATLKQQIDGVYARKDAECVQDLSAR